MVESGAEVTGDGRLEVERLACHRMMEGQTEGMQTHATARIFLTAILAVTHHGMTDVGHMDTDLVLAARLQMQIKQRAILGLFYEFPLGGCPLAAIVNRTAHDDHTVGIVQPALNPALRLLHDPLNYCDIATIDNGGMPVGCHLLLHVNTLGINHQTRCAGIQTVHYMGCASLTCLGKVLIQQRLHVQAASTHGH